MRILPFLCALILTAGCAGPNRRENPAAPPPSNPGDAPPDVGQDNPVVAFIDEEPVYWRAVVDHSMATRGKELIEQYILAKLRRDRVQELGIKNTPDELKRRAKVGLDAERRRAGPEQFQKWLDAQKLTEDQVVDRLAGNPNFDEIVKAEKAVAYSLLTEASIEIDTVAFTEEQEAAAFTAMAGRTSFGEAAERLATTPNLQGKVAHWPRYRFAVGLAPDAIADSVELEQKLFTMKKGQTTGVERTSKNILVVIYIVETYPAAPAAYPAIADKVLAEILRQPPSKDQIRLWLDRLLKSKRIRYEDRNTPGNQGR
jgi:hypothetical protein